MKNFHACETLSSAVENVAEPPYLEMERVVIVGCKGQQPLSCALLLISLKGGMGPKEAGKKTASAKCYLKNSGGAAIV